MIEKLTKENYRTNHNYMSYSTFCRFLKCEASAARHYHEPSSVSQLIGSYVDAYFSNEMSEFQIEHPEIFNSRTGELKKEFSNANLLISRAECDELFMEFMDGEKQVIMTGVICDVPFKIKIDVYKEYIRIVDLKIMKDFEKVWSNAYHSYIDFIKAYDYDIEMAIFQEVVFQNIGKKLPCYLCCITKETPSDIGIFEIPQKDLDNALKIVKNNLPRIKDILDGKIAPHRCEKCAYCRETKKARILHFEYAGLNGDQLREEGIECDDPKVIK